MLPINLNLKKVEFPKVGTDNLHRIAISNLEDPERLLVRWWARKYRQPQKPFEDHTWEEIFIEQLEDYYAANPVEADRFLAESGVSAQVEDDDDWDGTVPHETENARRAKQAHIKTAGHVDLSKYQKDDHKYSDAEVSQIIDNLGKNLPGSRAAKKAKTAPKETKAVQTLGGDEFDDLF